MSPTRWHTGLKGLKQDLKTTVHDRRILFACFDKLLAKCTRSQCVQDECYLKTNNNTIDIDRGINKPTAVYV